MLAPLLGSASGEGEGILVESENDAVPGVQRMVVVVNELKPLSGPGLWARYLT